MIEKLPWSGVVIAVQPRVRLMRSFDQRDHSYLGYSLLVRGAIAGRPCEFRLGVGPGAHEKHRFRVGDSWAGLCEAVGDEPRDPVDYYKVSKLELVERFSRPDPQPPPWQDVAPDLTVYRARGHRRLASQTYDRFCWACVWGCRMAVEMIIDQWRPDIRRYRTETFCYGPRSCPAYRPGPTRKVPGRKGMMWEEEDWVDEQETAHRQPDD